MNRDELQPIKQRYHIAGNSEQLNHALDIAIQVASTDLSVLIEGESGVGKEVIPKIIHDNSSRKHGKYFAINCGSIPEGTIDSELFGHEKGAFTGAIGEREGYFGAATGGTLFLDEVGELPLATQARLLRVLETGEYIRVGSNEVRKTNVRIVAATNVNMQNAIRERRFREDLYYRLATIPIAMPALRKRGKDVILLFRKFAKDMAEKYHFEPIQLTDEAKIVLMNYKWPGNIRQLKNVTEQISVLSRERLITPEILNAYGITDDSNSGTELAVRRTGTSFHNEEQDPHSYANERKALFGTLYKLSEEIRELKELINSRGVAHEHAAGITISGGNYYDGKPYHHGRHNTTDDYPDNTINEEPELVEAMEDTPNVAPPPNVATFREREKESIMQALELCDNNRKKVASMLGISDRTLYRKIDEYGLRELYPNKRNGKKKYNE